MVSAVFHTPLQASLDAKADAANRLTASTPAMTEAAPLAPAPARRSIDWNGLLAQGVSAADRCGPADRHLGTADDEERDVPVAAGHLRCGGQALRRPVLLQGPERPGHRLEHSVLPRARGRGLRHGRPGRHTAGFHDRTLRGAQPDGVATDQPAAAGVTTGVVADRPAGVQGGESSRHLDHLHLLDLADDHQHRRGCTACAVRTT